MDWGWCLALVGVGLLQLLVWFLVGPRLLKVCFWGARNLFLLNFSKEGCDIDVVFSAIFGIGCLHHLESSQFCISSSVSTYIGVHFCSPTFCLVDLSSHKKVTF